MKISDAVTVTSLILGAACILVGLALMWSQRNAKVPEATAQKVGEQGAISDVLGGVTDLAKALKDLDRGVQVITIGVALVAIAALGAGFDNVANAVSSVAAK